MQADHEETQCNVDPTRLYRSCPSTCPDLARAIIRMPPICSMCCGVCVRVNLRCLTTLLSLHAFLPCPAFLPAYAFLPCSSIIFCLSFAFLPCSSIIFSHPCFVALASSFLRSTPNNISESRMRKCGSSKQFWRS